MNVVSFLAGVCLHAVMMVLNVACQARFCGGAVALRGYCKALVEHYFVWKAGVACAASGLFFSPS